MQESEVTELLNIYSVPAEDTDRILMGLSKIRSNIDLLESDQPFEDDTRNLIKQVIKLTERTEPSSDTVLVHYDPLSSPPLFVTGPQEPGEAFDDGYSRNGFTGGQRLLRSGRFSSDQAGEIELFNEMTSPPVAAARSGSESHPSSCFSINQPNTQFSFTCPSHAVDLTTQTLNRNSRRSKTPVPFQRFCRALSPVSHRINAAASLRNNVQDGGLSVPSTPVPKVYGTPVHQKPAISPAKGAVMSTSYTSTNDGTPPHSPCSFYPANFFQRNSNPRDRSLKMPVTPPSKHKIKFTFPLHRSKSHESNLASKIYANGNAKAGGNASPRHPGKINNNLPLSPDSHSPGANEANVFCFPTPTHAVNAPPSPKCNSAAPRPEHNPNMIMHSGK